jgi:hypothetical protein
MVKSLQSKNQGAITMTEQPHKKLSRRDALKVLAAAAGATALANLPNKWSKPGIEVGVLPAHAQTSVIVKPHTLNAAADNPEINLCQPNTFTSTVTIDPPDSGISLNFTIIPSAGVIISTPASLTGTKTTTLGTASLDITATNPGGGGTVEVSWSFANTSDGTDSDSQFFMAGGC